MKVNDLMIVKGSDPGCGYNVSVSESVVYQGGKIKTICRTDLLPALIPIW